MYKIQVFLLIIVLVGAAGGCAVVNFSGHYYDLPPNTSSEVHGLFRKIVTELPLRYSYKYVVLSDAEFEKSKGIPAISEDTVIIPENFLRYVYQNYYDDRTIILSSIIVHELCHKEYGLPSKPPKEHFKVDQCAIALIGQENTGATYYYQSLYVMKNYWFARKGMAGHAFNVGWNVANAAVLALTGHGVFADWFATDLEERMRLISRNYDLLPHHCFPRSKGPHI